MKRKTVTAFLMSLCLAVSVPGTVCAADIQSAVDTVPQSQNEETKEVSDSKTEEKEQTPAKEQQEIVPDTVKKSTETDEQEEKDTEDTKKADRAEHKQDTKDKEKSGISQQAADQMTDIENKVEAAVKVKDPDMSSQVMKDFIEASNAYDKLSDSEKKELSADTKNNMEVVRKRIAEKIQTTDGVTVEAWDADSPLPWYIKVEVKESAQKDAVLQAAAKRYTGSAPKIVYGKDISFTDIRTGKACSVEDFVSFWFPVPEGYDTDALGKLEIVVYDNGNLYRVSPEKKDDRYYVDMTSDLQNIYILELPVALTGITMEQNVSINAGQKQQLQVTAVPENATEAYELEWSSSQPQVATVDAAGMVTAVKEGTAVITAKVKGTEFSVSCTVTVVQGAHELQVSMSNVMDQTRKYMQSVDVSPTLGSEWFVLGQARSGVDTNGTYFKTYYNHIANYLTEKKGRLTSSVKYTEYSKMILVMTSMGKDARNIAGYNLFEPLADFETVVGQGTNGPIWALLALNCNPAYSIPEVRGVKVQTTEQKLIDYLLGKETKKGGWSMTGDAPDSDLTGMALQALAPYYRVKGYERVTAAVDRALEVLSSMQNQSGGYSTMGVETSESAAQVLTGLCALGIDPMKDERFVKGGSWIVENLLTYHIANSGFMHVKAGAENNGGGVAGAVNGMATEQAYYALTAYQRLLDNKTALYDMSDIKLEKGDAGDGKGTGLENQNRDNGKDDPKKDNTAKDDTKKDDGKKNDTKNDDKKKGQITSKKKLTYKGKRLTLTSSSGKAGTKTEKGDADEMASTDGSSATGSSLWDFEPEEYVEDEDGGTWLSSAVDTGDGTEAAVTGTDGADAQMSQGTETMSGAGEVMQGRSLALFFGGAAAGAVAAVGGIWLYLKKKQENAQKDK